MTILFAFSSITKPEEGAAAFRRNFSPGIQVGEKVPDFQLPDQNNTLRRLSDLLGENGALLNFYRSADW